LKRLASIGVLTLTLAACGGGGESSGKTFATVNGEKVTQSDADALVSYSRARAQEEGEDFPATGAAQYRAVEKKAVDTLVTLAEFEQKADSLGIHIDKDAIEERAKSLESEGSGKDDKETERAKELLAKLGLLRDALFAQITKDVTVTAPEIRAYLEKNRVYYENFPAAKKTIRAQVVGVKKNAVADAFFRNLPSEFKVTYSELR
jgi:hypothetical protein